MAKPLLGWLAPGIDGVKDAQSNVVTASFVPVISPYASVTPADLGKPNDALGINVVVLAFDHPSIPVTPPFAGKDRKIVYPLSVFLERSNIASGKPQYSVGAGLTFKFP